MSRTPGYRAQEKYFGLSSLAFGLGANAVGIVAQVIWPRFQLVWIYITFGFAVIAIGAGLVFFYASFKPVPSKAWAWLITLVIIGAGTLDYIAVPLPTGACSARVDPVTLGSFLTNEQQKGLNSSHRKIRVVVERGRKENCKYATELHKAFQIGGWNPDPISDEPTLAADAVYFHAPDDDRLAVEFYEQLISDQFIRLHFGAASPPEWIFWIKDSWPKVIP